MLIQIPAMKKSTLLTFGFALAITAFAQKAQTFALPFASGTESFTLSENPWGAGIPSSEEIVNGHYYRLVHFTALPNGREREELAAKGVNCLFFEHGTCYIASIAVGTNFPIAGTKLKGVSFISAQSKMLTELSYANNTKAIPAFALDADGLVGITAYTYGDIPMEIVLADLNKLNIPVTYANPNSHRLTAWVPADGITALCALPYVCFAELVDDVPQPDNNPGRTNHRDNWLAQEYAGGNAYNGQGVNVMLQDDGIIGPHIDYTGRLQAQYIAWNTGNHGDHCAGIIMGAGNKDPLTRGMGWGANLYVYSAVPYTGWDSIYTHYYTNNIVITSTSYSDGCNAGYTTLAQELDQQLWDMPNLIHVFSAGNNGGVDCQYGAGTAFGNITGGHKHSKNSIAVGNLDYLDNLNSSSSVGPVHDGRMKPEVCAVGTSVYSTVNDNTYEFKTGTSMSCPAVSGTFSEMYNALQVIYGTTPKSGIMKAILMNTCDDIMNPGPDFKTGYGRINGRKALNAIEQSNFITDSIDDQQTHQHTIAVPAGVGELKVMIYWHDYPAAANASVALVNNLNMTVTDPSTSVTQPWVLDYTPTVSALNAPAVHGTDIRNNHEQVTITNPASGNYTVTVNGAAVPMGPQTYFITWYFEPADELVLTYPNGGEGFAPGEGQTIRWDAQTDTGTVSLEYTADGGSTWNSIASNLQASDLAYGWTVPAALSGACRVRIYSNTNADTSDADFTIAGIPSNFQVAWSCPDSLCLKWTAVPGATTYDVFTLGAVYMDSIGSTALDSFVVTGLNNYTNTYWFSVRTRGAMQATGRRAVALEKTPGIFCPGQYDAAVTTVVSPLQNYTGCMTVTNIPVTISITNPGLTSISNFPVSYSFNGGPIITETYSGTIAPSSTVSHTFASTVSLPMPGSYPIVAWSSQPADIVTSNDTLNMTITYFVNTLVVPPYSENFESFTACSTTADCGGTSCTMINGWHNVGNGLGDDIDWRTDFGGTPTSGTGPGVDFSPGNAVGKYLYLESTTCDLSTAELISPCIDLTTFQNPNLLFGYHMYGTGMGSLHIDVYSNGNWINDVYVRNGSQNMNWLQATVPLSAYMGQMILIRFRGITGSGGTSDMAIDFVRIEDPTATPEYTPASLISVFPNPASGQFNFAVEGVNNEVIRATVYDVSGRMVLSQDYGSQYGAFQSVIDLTPFENGTYFLEVAVGDRSSTTRLIKEQ